MVRPYMGDGKALQDNRPEQTECPMSAIYFTIC
jgi:hypothetical protein